MPAAHESRDGGRQEPWRSGCLSFDVTCGRCEGSIARDFAPASKISSRAWEDGVETGALFIGIALFGLAIMTKRWPY